MKKTKKLLSLLTALAISASAFAGLAVPVGAADTPISGASYDFESYNVSSEAGAIGNVTNNEWGEDKGNVNYNYSILQNSTLNSKVLKADQGGSGGRNATLKLPTAITPETDPIKVQFKWYSNTAGGSNSTGLVLVDSNKNQIFNIKETNENAIYVNDNETSLSRGWYTVSAVLDFETHKILSLSLTANGSDTPAKEYSNIDFLSAEASNIYGFYIDGIRGAKNTLTVDLELDDINFYTTDDYFKAEITVADSDSVPVSDAEVTIEDTKYTTNASGKVTAKLLKGSEYSFTVSKIGYVDAAGNDTASGTLTESAASANVTYSLAPYTPEVTSVTVGGGQALITAPTGETAAKSVAFTVAVKDQNETAMEAGYTTEWAVYPTGTTTADANVTIANGEVSVTKNYKAASGDASVFDVVAVVTDSANSEKTATSKSTITIANSDILLYDIETSFTASGDKSKDYDIDDVTIPEGGLRITFGYFKGKFDMTSDSAYGQLSFKNGDDTIFYIKDTNSDGATLYTDDEHSVILGSSERDKEYPVELTIIGSQLIAKFNDGEYKVVEFAEAPTTITSINASTSQNGGSGTGATKLVMSSKLTVDKSKVNIVGDNEFAKITGKTVTREYQANAYVPEASDSFTWTVTEATGVSIDAQTGVLSVTDQATPGTVTVTATSGTKTGSLKVEIKDVSTNLAPAVAFPRVMQPGETKRLTVEKIVDEYGDDVTEYFTPVWSIYDAPSLDTDVTFNTADKSGKAVAISAVKDENGVLKSISTQDIAISDAETKVTAEGGAIVYLWDSLEGMIPIDEPKTAPDAEIDDDAIAAIGAQSGILKAYKASEDVTVTLILAEGIEVDYRLKIADFSMVVENPEAGAVDVSDIVNYGADTYTVTLADGTSFVTTAAEGEITLTAEELKGTDKIEIVPNYKFNLGGVETEGFTVIDDDADGFGFTDTATPVAGTGTGIQSKGVNLDSNSFEVELPDGRYDMTFYKADTNRTHIRVNDYMTVTEADFQDGDDGTADPLSGPGVYTKLDVNVTGGVAKINAYNWDKGVPLMAAVEITKKSDLAPRKTHVWIAGDSTVCIYRPSPTTDSFAAGTRRTGWGQLLQNYLSDDVIVDDFAHSGDWADNWYKNTFPSVLQHAEAGDYLIIQFGINDRTRTPDQKVMSAALSNMIDECRAKGVIPVLQTPELCVSQYGTQVTEEHTKPTGSGHAGYFEVNRTVAKEKNTLLIDLADISATMWATMGKTWVSRNYFLWNSSTNAQLDAQHMSYNGAKLVASMVATEILDQQAAGKKGASGESFAGIPVNAKVQANVTYTDASDNQEKTIERQAAAFVPSAN